MKAHEILSDESKWTKYVNARDATGIPCRTDSSQAVCFCIVGAICAAWPYGQKPILTIKAMHQALNIGSVEIGQWNDAPERTFAEVRNLLLELDI